MGGVPDAGRPADAPVLRQRQRGVPAASEGRTEGLDPLVGQALAGLVEAGYAQRQVRIYYYMQVLVL